MSWFEDLTGIVEHDPEHVRGQLELDGERLRSLANGQSCGPGRLKISTLAELRKQVADLDSPGPGQLILSERVADVRELHQDASQANAMFQVASQFNLLEMVHPGVCPEQGIGRYQSDRTQGPICAMASEQGLRQIAEHLDGIDEPARDTLRQQLKIGIQWNTEVTLPGAGHTVSQAYCSALPVAYSREPSSLWEPFARLVLEASYDAVFCAARINQARTGSNQLFLTLIGGGAFGNRSEWITDAIEYAVDRHKASGLYVQIVSYGRSQPAVAGLIERADHR